MTDPPPSRDQSVIALCRGGDRVELRPDGAVVIVESRAEPALSRPRSIAEERTAQAHYDRLRVCWELILGGWPSEYVRATWLYGARAIVPI